MLPTKIHHTIRSVGSRKSYTLRSLTNDRGPEKYTVSGLIRGFEANPPRLRRCQLDPVAYRPKWFGDMFPAVPREKNLHFQPQALN
jgi:hypothetical protein